MRLFMLCAFRTPQSKEPLVEVGPLNIKRAQVRIEEWERQGLHFKAFELFPVTLSETFVKVKKTTIV